MSTKIPQAISNYLLSTPYQNNLYAYLELDEANRVIDKGGTLDCRRITDLNPAVSIEEQLPQLLGLLPVKSAPLVIANTHIDATRFIDLHLFFADKSQWVLLLDNTEAATKLQSEQQIRLDSEIYNEKNSVSTDKI